MDHSHALVQSEHEIRLGSTGRYLPAAYAAQAQAMADVQMPVPLIHEYLTNQAKRDPELRHPTWSIQDIRDIIRSRGNNEWDATNLVQLLIDRRDQMGFTFDVRSRQAESYAEIDKFFVEVDMGFEEYARNGGSLTRTHTHAHAHAHANTDIN